MIVDVTAGVGEWAFDPLKRTSPGELSIAMQEEGIHLALVYPIEGVCYKNPHMIIDEHFERLEPYPNLIPVPVINPLLGDSEGQVRKAWEKEAPAVRLLPNYHGYDPGCAEVGNLLDLCGRMSIAVMFSLRLEDPRRQHRVMNVDNVDLEPVLDIIENHEETTVIICGLSRVGSEKNRERILDRPDTYIDTSFLEYQDTLNTVSCSLDHHYERIMFGTHSPFFYMRANMVKLSAVEDPDILQMITFENAFKALGLKDRCECLKS